MHAAWDRSFYFIKTAFFSKHFVPNPNNYCSLYSCLWILSQMHMAQSCADVFEHTLTHKILFHFKWMAFLYLKKMKKKTWNLEWQVVSTNAGKVLNHLNKNW